MFINDQKVRGEWGFYWALCAEAARNGIIIDGTGKPETRDFMRAYCGA